MESNIKPFILAKDVYALSHFYPAATHDLEIFRKEIGDRIHFSNIIALTNHQIATDPLRREDRTFHKQHETKLQEDEAVRITKETARKKQEYQQRKEKRRRLQEITHSIKTQIIVVFFTVYNWFSNGNWEIRIQTNHLWILDSPWDIRN